MKNKKFNKDMLWSAGGILVFGVLAVIAFEAIGFDGYGLHTLSDAGGVAGTIYGCAVAGIVFAWLVMILPLLNMFGIGNQYTKWFGFATLGFLVLALILMIAAEGKYCDVAFGYDKGDAAGVFILMFIGAAVGIGGTVYGYYDNIFRKTAKVTSKPKNA